MIHLGVVDIGALLAGFGVNWRLLTVQSINFLLVAFLLYRFAFKNVVQALDERKAKIESGLKYADKMREEVAIFEETRSTRIESVKREAEEILNFAKNDARTILDNGKEESRQMVGIMIAEANKEIAKTREHALNLAKSEIGTLVVDIAEHVLSTKITAAQQKSYIEMAKQSILDGQFSEEADHQLNNDESENNRPICFHITAPFAE